MRITRGIAALAGVLALACGLVAWEWFVHTGRNRPVPQPVQQIADSTPVATPTPAPTHAPVVYVPQATAQPTPSPTPLKTDEPVPAVSPHTVTTAAPAVKLTPYAVGGTPTISQEPMVVATLAPRTVNAEPLREAQDAPPRILSMSISTPVARGGEVVSGTVETTSNVASVEARIAGYSTSMEKIGVGRFALSYRVPKLPFFLHRTYTIEVIARNTRGDAVSSSVPITIR